MQAQRTSDEYAVWLNALLRTQGIVADDIDGAVIGTVVPAALYHLRTLCRQWFAVEPLLASARLDWGFAIKVDNPDEVGVDRSGKSLQNRNAIELMYKMFYKNKLNMYYLNIY